LFFHSAGAVKMSAGEIIQTIAALAFAGISTTAFIIWFAERSRPDTAGDGSAWGDVVSVPQEMRAARKMAEGGRSEQRGRPVTDDVRTHRGSGK
jgi:hypothetical protein